MLWFIRWTYHVLTGLTDNLFACWASDWGTFVTLDHNARVDPRTVLWDASIIFVSAFNNSALASLWGALWACNLCAFIALIGCALWAGVWSTCLFFWANNIFTGFAHNLLACWTRDRGACVTFDHSARVDPGAILWDASIITISAFDHSALASLWSALWACNLCAFVTCIWRALWAGEWCALRAFYRHTGLGANHLINNTSD